MARFSTEVYAQSKTKPASVRTSPARLASSTPRCVRSTSVQPGKRFSMFQTDSPWRTRTTLCMCAFLDAALIRAARKHFIMSPYGNSRAGGAAPTPGHFRAARPQGADRADGPRNAGHCASVAAEDPVRSGRAGAERTGYRRGGRDFAEQRFATPGDPPGKTHPQSEEGRQPRVLFRERPAYAASYRHHARSAVRQPAEIVTWRKSTF